jgi:mycothiol synthase
MNTRHVTPEDLDDVLELLRADEEHLLGRRSRIGRSDLLQWLSRVDLDDDTWLLEEEGRLVACGWAETHGDLGWAIGVVHPEAKGRGIGEHLVEWSEQQLRERGVTRVHQVAFAGDTRAPMLFAAHGYREVRRFYEMAIELDGPPPAPVLHGGFTIETFDEASLREFYEALDESFQDHWEHHTTPLAEWWKQNQDAPNFDPTLWFLIRDGAEVAAVVRNEPNRREGGMVAAIGVRRPWRGRGLGRALLLHTFGEFHRRGVNRISLGVDTENPTGATKLYESVGMHVELEDVVFEKMFT